MCAAAAVINIGSFIALTVEPDNVHMQFAQYMVVIVMLCIGAYVFAFHIPDTPVKNNGDSFSSFLKDLRDWRDWFPVIRWNAIALLGDMCGVALFSGVAMYIFDNKAGVPLLGPDSTVVIPHNAFLAVYNTCTFLGDTLSRKIAYWMRPVNPLWFLLLTGTGAALVLSKHAVMAWVGIFLVFFANGSIYANTTRHIDSWGKKDQSLISLSVWLFVGDMGSVTGSNLVPYVKAGVGPVVCNHCH